MSAVTEIRPPYVAAPSAEAFLTGDFPTRWRGRVRFDLSGSESEPMGLAQLLALARPDDLKRWDSLDFGYPDLRGSPWLRRTVALQYADLGPDDILCCAGAQEALTCLAHALLSPHDHAVIVVPIYPPAERAVSSRCATTGVPLRLSAGRWTLDLDEIEKALRPNTRLVLTNFPNSPTGAAIGEAELDLLVALCRRRGIWLVNDEVYRLTAPEPDILAPPVVDRYEHGISINAVSKGLGLPGLRVGWIACRDPAVLRNALSAKSQLSACLASTAEVLANVALRAGDIIVTRNRALAEAHAARLHALLQRHQGLFDVTGAGNLAFGFPRYLGREGAEGLAEALARHLGLLVLPSGLWRSPLAAIPGDHVRIGLGRRAAGPALDALDEYLAGG